MQLKKYLGEDSDLHTLRCYQHNLRQYSQFLGPKYLFEFHTNILFEEDMGV